MKAMHLATLAETFVTKNSCHAIFNRCFVLLYDFYYLWESGVSTL